MEKARKIYNEMILDKSQLGKYSSAIWLEFIELESRYGDEKHERKLLTRAINELTDDDEREVIYEAAVRFEKLNGTVGQFVSVYNRSEAFKAQREVEKAKKAAAEQEKRTQDNKKPSGANKAAPKQPKQQQQAKKSGDDSTATNNSLKRKVTFIRIRILGIFEDKRGLLNNKVFWIADTWNGFANWERKSSSKG